MLKPQIIRHFTPLFCLFSTLLVTLFTTGHLVAAQSYNLKDLTILAKENNFKEYIDHALDIRPSERSAEWAKMTKRMSILYIDNKLHHKQYNEAIYRQVQSLNEIPVLRSDERFGQTREKYVLEYLRACFNKKNSVQCIQRLELFWNSISRSMNRSDIGVNLARVIKANIPQHDIWKYISPATTGQLAEFHCKRPEVKKALFKKISDELRSLPNNKNLLSKLNAIASDKCWSLVYTDLNEALYSSNQTTSLPAYRVLNLKGKLSELDKNTFLFTYILNGPVVGETFNEAWKVIESLGENYKMRKEVLAKILDQDYIPDELFNTPDKKKRDILIDLIDKNIPEFIDHYAKTCLDYLEGKKNFPNGNPTKHCRTLFKISKKKPWPGHGLKSRYNALPKF